MKAIVVDTHAIVWYFLQSQKLSAAALAAIDNADSVYVAAISVIEIIYLQEKGKIPEIALQRLNHALADTNQQALKNRVSERKIKVSKLRDLQETRFLKQVQA
jgi:PIN domain nuclease of toxin-antitoxin system